MYLAQSSGRFFLKWYFKNIAYIIDAKSIYHLQLES